MSDRSSPAEKGFIMVDDRKSFKAAAKTRIAQMTGTPPAGKMETAKGWSRKFTDQELLALYNDNNSSNPLSFLSSPLYQKIIGLPDENSGYINKADLARMLAEKKQEFL